MSGNIIWTGSGEQAFEFYSVSGIQSFLYLDDPVFNTFGLLCLFIVILLWLEAMLMLEKKLL